KILMLTHAPSQHRNRNAKMYPTLAYRFREAVVETVEGMEVTEVMDNVKVAEEPRSEEQI
ncbi:hypothetical protein, partial [Ciceribacter ferrooxidans]|uniref:hypothetical protein n=1 Tax=Ciceribacter ferrooxidans TaxID=2509717 RepID=UPI00196B4441